jgi:prepilin-type N-terminal cleavage/methylation domain-containing protein
MNRSRFSNRHGLTLIELVVVLLILASIAAMVIARLGFVEDQAGNASTANAAADVLHNLEVYKTSTGNYPDRMDSLLENAGADVMSTHWTHPGGTVPFERIDINTLSGTGGTAWTTSISHSGVSSAVDYDTTTRTWTLPGRALSTAGGRAVCAVTVSPAAATPTNASRIIETAAGFPNGLSTDATGPTVRLIAFGIGPHCSMIGTTMGTAPSHAEQSGNAANGHPNYNRYIAIFAVYGNGKVMELRTVLDSFRGSIESNIQGYKNAAPTES